MKKNIFFLFTIIVIFISLDTFTITIAVSRIDGDTAGTIGIPVTEILLLLIYLVVSKCWFHIRFHFNIKQLVVPFKNVYYASLVIVPTVVMVLFNIITSKPLSQVLKEVPSGQIWMAVFLSLISAILTGFFEETMDRGGVLQYLMTVFVQKSNGLIYAIALSSLLFGFLHLGNTIFGGESLVYTLYQVVYAFAFGAFMSTVYVKFGTLFLPVLLHALIDWSDFFFNMAGEPSMHGLAWVPITMTLLFGLSTVLLYRTITRKEKLSFLEHIDF